MSGNLVQRIGFAAVAIPLAVGMLFWGGWALVALLALLGVLGTREVYDLARRQGIESLEGPGLVAAAAIPAAAFAASGAGAARAGWLAYAAALWLLVVFVAALAARGPKARPLAAVAVTVFGALYTSGLLSFIIAIRHGLNSAAQPRAYAWLVVLPLAVTWICDTAAYAAGTAFGGPKLAPVLSPKKTWAGALGGMVGALVFAPVLGLLILNRVGWQLGVWQLAAVGLVVGVVGQAGDVAESLLKREAGVKDSSALIPGHGGVLDRLDSLYFVVPASAALFKLYGII